MRREKWYCCTLVFGEHGERRFSACLRAWTADQALAEFEADLGPEWTRNGVVAVREGASLDRTVSRTEDPGVHEGVP